MRRAGLRVADEPAAADSLVWCSSSPDGLAGVLRSAERLRWVQLPLAGIERFVPLVRSRAEGLVWTCAKAVYGPAVAELCMALLVGGFRQLHRYPGARAWHPLQGRLLAGSRIAVLGGGGIGKALVQALAPFSAVVTVVSRSGAPVMGASTVTADATEAVVAEADAVVLALPLTAETAGLVDRRFLSTMRRTAWLVNVARGPIVVTSDLVAALRAGTLAGAALDVTDPEPLPEGHALWDLDNAVVTPHVANTYELGVEALGGLVERNAGRFATGAPLEGVVDPVAGY